MSLTSYRAAPPRVKDVYRAGGPEIFESGLRPGGLLHPALVVVALLWVLVSGWDGCEDLGEPCWEDLAATYSPTP